MGEGNHWSRQHYSSNFHLLWVLCHCETAFHVLNKCKSIGINAKWLEEVQRMMSMLRLSTLSNQRNIVNMHYEYREVGPLAWAPFRESFYPRWRGRYNEVLLFTSSNQTRICIHSENEKQFLNGAPAEPTACISQCIRLATQYRTLKQLEIAWVMVPAMWHQPSMVYTQLHVTTVGKIII